MGLQCCCTRMRFLLPPILLFNMGPWWKCMNLNSYFYSNTYGEAQYSQNALELNNVGINNVGINNVGEW